MRIQNVNNNKNNYNPKFQALLIKGELTKEIMSSIDGIADEAFGVRLKGGLKKYGKKEFFVLNTETSSRENSFSKIIIPALISKIKNSSVKNITEEEADVYIKAYLKKHPKGLELPYREPLWGAGSPVTMSDFISRGRSC